MCGYLILFRSIQNNVDQNGLCEPVHRNMLSPTNHAVRFQKRRLTPTAKELRQTFI